MFSDQDIDSTIEYFENNLVVAGEPFKSNLIEMLRELRQLRQQKPVGHICEDHISPEFGRSFVASLTAVGPNKIQVIKALRQLITGLGLKEGKDMVDGCNGHDRPVIKRGIGIEEAQEIANELAKVGALVTINEDNRTWAGSIGDRFDAVLAETGPNKIMVIKIVRDHTGLGLKECKEMTDDVIFNPHWTTSQLYERGRFIMRRITREAAEDLRKDLEYAGAKVCLVDSRGQKWTRLEI